MSLVGAAGDTSLLAPFAGRGMKLDDAAQAELALWTGGIPILALAVCDSLYRRSPAPAVLDKATVQQSAGQIAASHRPYLEELWQDLPTESRLDVLDLTRSGQFPYTNLPKERAEVLVARGLATRSQNTLKSSCRLLQDYAQASGHTLPDMKRLFAAPGDYAQHLPDVLRMRLAQLAGFAPDASKHLATIIKSIPEPETAKELIRGLGDRCLDILLTQLFPTGKLDPAWPAEWVRNHQVDPVKNADICAGKIPRYRGQQMKLLDLVFDEASGGKVRSDPSVFYLLRAVYDAGTYGQHAVEIGGSCPAGS